MATVLKAPYPWFGGKSRVSDIVWRHFGEGVTNFIEPFYGSGAVHLSRPTPFSGVETVNDLDCYVANFWRATQADPEAVVSFVDWPVSEVDLHARHKWLVQSDEAKAFRERMRADPHHFDARIAGYWCWGLCCWIGSGWCTPPSEEVLQLPRMGNDVALRAGPRQSEQLPKLSGFASGCVPESSGTQPKPNRKRQRLTGANGGHRSPPQRRPIIAGDNAGSVGKGVHAKGQLPKLSSSDSVLGAPSEGELSQQVPWLKAGGQGANRPQLADAYDVGRGVHSAGDLGTCEARREWLLDWFRRLRDRLRLVRVCCGDWSRVCSSDSVTTRLGITAVFLDPPYSAEAGRSEKLYACEDLDVAHEVRAWCQEWGKKPLMRICLAGYQGEGHEVLEAEG